MSKWLCDKCKEKGYPSCSECIDTQLQEEETEARRRGLCQLCQGEKGIPWSNDPNVLICLKCNETLNMPIADVPISKSLAMRLKSKEFLH